VKNVKIYLISILTVVGALPVLLSFLLVYSFVGYQAEVSSQLNFEKVIDEYSKDLKVFSKKDSSNEGLYKAKFETLQETKILTESNSGVLKKVERSILKFYVLFFGLFVLITFFLGSFLSKLVSDRFNEAYSELQKKTEKEKYLAQFEKISEITKKLNHELKKPLGPIEIWNQNALASFKEKEEGFEQVFLTSSKVISEEVGILKKMINYFHNFSSLPEPVLKPVDVVNFVDWVRTKFKETYTNVEFIAEEEKLEKLMVSMDEGLMSQIFQNLIENAIEANFNTTVKISISMVVSKSNVEIYFTNWGVEIKNPDSIFQDYVSSKSSVKNSGLGLPIIKISMLKHGGDIEALPFEGGARFKLTLPYQEVLV